MITRKSSFIDEALIGFVVVQCFALKIHAITWNAATRAAIKR